MFAGVDFYNYSIVGHKFLLDFGMKMNNMCFLEWHPIKTLKL